MSRSISLLSASLACWLISPLALAFNELGYQDLYYPYPKNYQKIRWIDATPIVLPSGQLSKPAERLHPTYTCKAIYRDGIYPGYVRDEGCSIGVDGRNMIVPEFQMPVTPWGAGFVSPDQISLSDQIPTGATFPDRSTSPMCRVQENGQFYSGYYENGYCHIGRGIELWRSHFDVLIAP